MLFLHILKINEKYVTHYKNNTNEKYVIHYKKQHK
jgi:hypothetical protein